MTFVIFVYDLYYTSYTFYTFFCKMSDINVTENEHESGMTRVVDSLYLGNYYDAKTNPHMDVIISALTPEEYVKYGVNPPPHVEWHRLLIDDSEKEWILDQFYVVHAIIRKWIRGKSILVHCAAGISRSPTLVAAYLMIENGWTRRKAIEYLSKLRMCICPNDTFMNQLKTLESRILNTSLPRTPSVSSEVEYEETESVDIHVKKLQVDESDDTDKENKQDL